MKLKLRNPIEAEKFWDSLPRNKQTRASARTVARAVGLRSIGEVRFAANLMKRNIRYDYEPERFPYTPKVKFYKPDFRLIKADGSPMYVEYKGNLTGPNRTTLKHVMRDHPDLDIRIVYGKPGNKLSRNSKTTYMAWSEQFNLPWGDTILPTEWEQELI